MTSQSQGDGLDWPKLFATRAERMKASEIRELLKLLDQPDVISFAGGIPDPALFPAKAFSEALAQSLEGDQAGLALQYSVSEGYLPLRQWLAERMASLGVPCTADNIVITTGSQQALDFLGKLFLSPGDTALVGWPTYLGALQAFNAYEPRYDRLNPMGNRLPADFTAAAEAAGGRVKFAYLSGDFANPTGETVTREARERVLDLAEAMDIPVIEDAAYQSLRYEGEEVPPILALDIARHGGIENTRTLYCGSFSKTLAPGLRVGWVCGATPVIQKLVLTKQAADLHSSTLNQMAIHKVASADFPGQVGRIKAAYKSRRDAMLSAPCVVHARRRELDASGWRHVRLADAAGKDRRRQSAGRMPETRKGGVRAGQGVFCRWFGRQHDPAVVFAHGRTGHCRGRGAARARRAAGSGGVTGACTAAGW